MLSKTLSNFVRHMILKNKRLFHTYAIAPIFNYKQYNLCPNYSYLQQTPNFITQKRWKSKKTKNHKDDDSEDEESEDEKDFTDVDDYLKTAQSKVIDINVPSPRLDIVAKEGFGMSRAKIDQAYYDNKIRINGKKCLKKSVMVRVEDEIDLIIDRRNTFLTVHRCTILMVNVSEGSTKIKLLRNKSLLIEDYDLKNAIS
ncbi:mitochondrial transcription rescue factor 1 [Nomia melanderi]|uniref:mitochondrial transcription rescue factor 1 n=1 Tax=Nomia melanderi TaxID=2448451 RepID=UPI00130452A8|nr:mitochondrial transcription rescue factor 1 [Nomia melanderi]XP_031834441.1 mitochondrial transcription rescue factor 1 [Nomia melanderi]XP_031834442.1 mitochondrial transcription rescue factor 1 [Nomia melanderi]XP_031834443.1 mitochondrial transcription rescue factor 1 [Nomia melanderi]